MFEFVFSRKNPETPVAYASVEAMHTVLEMILVSPDEEFSKQIIEQAFAMVKQMDSLFNRFDANSEIGKLNRRDTPTCMITDKQVYTLLEYCENSRKKTGGYFDVTALSRYETHPPAIPYRLDRNTNAVTFSNCHTQIDVGGIAKGFALEAVNQLLASHAIGRALVNFGNSSVLAVGTHPYGDYWPVAVEHVAQSGVAACHLELADNALSVSGLTPQREGHIKNPLTNAYCANEELVVVKGVSPLIAEALSTALYAAPDNERPRILSNYENYTAYTIRCKKGTKATISEIGNTNKRV
ncbi:MAG: FAD:protein FMN transferase [Dysgonamonadaceae bacterium]|nr:FAD:protein FMN transferase [Dysgonamonadaceae bacterium]